MPTRTESDLPNVGSPARRALAGAGITELRQLTKRTEGEFAGLHGVGPTAVTRLREALQAKGLAFADG